MAGSIDDGWIVSYEVWTVIGEEWDPNYVIKNISSDDYNRTGTGSSDSLTAYTHPGDCTIWSSLSSGARLKSELIKVSEVSDWLQHYRKWLSWSEQDSHYDDDMSVYIPTTEQRITANWYNLLANLVNVTEVNSGDRIQASHFTALSNAIS